MNYSFFIPLLCIFIMTGCSERKPLSVQEKWDKFCKTYDSAAYNIMSDRQHDVTLDKSVDHLKKLPEGQEREMLIELVHAAHQTPKYDQQVDKEKAMQAFKQGKYQSCMEQQPSQS